MKDNLKSEPEIRFPEFSTAWFETSLGDLLTFKNGLNATKEDYGGGDKFINVLDIIQNNFITYDKIIGSVRTSEKNKELYKVEYGDVLFQRSSETREEVGQANVYLDREKPALFGGFVIRGKKVGEYHPVFLNYLLKTPATRNDITSRSGGSTRYNVGQETLSSVKISTTGLSEQQKIASFLSSVDERIELLERKKEKLEAYKKGVMQQIFSRRIRFKQDDGSEFPEWEEKRLGEVCDIIGGGTPDTLISDYWDGEINWFTPTEIKKKYLTSSKKKITETGLKKSSAKLLPKGSLLFTSRATIGEVGIISDVSTTNQGFQSFLPRKNLLIEFIYYWIKQHQKLFIRKSSGSTFLEISKSEIQKIIIRVPHLSEQKKIAAFLGSLDENLGTLDSQIQGLKTWKKGLLQQMFV